MNRPSVLGRGRFFYPFWNHPRNLWDSPSLQISACRGLQTYL